METVPASGPLRASPVDPVLLQGETAVYDGRWDGRVYCEVLAEGPAGAEPWREGAGSRMFARAAQTEYERWE